MVSQFLSRKPVTDNSSSVANVALPTIYHGANLAHEAIQMKTLHETIEIQQFLRNKRDQAKAQSRRTARAKLLAEAAVDAGTSPYDGCPTRCPICLESFEAGDPVCRLKCRHVVHESCLKAFLLVATTKVKSPACPECRGPTDDPKYYKYVADRAPSESSGDEAKRKRTQPPSGTPERYDIFTTPKNSRCSTPKNSRHTSDNSTTNWSQVPGPFMPMWQVEGQANTGPNTQEEKCYHGSTNLPDGRQGLLVDPGAWSNLAGETWILKMARKAVESGLKVSETRMAQPLKVAGVGTGSNSAEWEIQVPIAVCDSEGSVNMHAYNTPVVRGEGKELPALLGLQSMSRQNSVLEMAPGNEFLTMPGPGGYTVNWSPGTVRYKLERAPSGHLLLPCDVFSKLQKNPGGVQEPLVTFYGTPSATKNTCEIGTQTDKDLEQPKTSFAQRLKKANVQTQD